MSLFKGSYLRVLTPMTTDGRTPRLDSNNTILYKETQLPMTAKRDLEILNKDLPDILKKKIEVVSSKDSYYEDEEVAATPTVKDKNVSKK